MNYVQLAEKFAKEKTVKEEAVINNKILGAKMQSKVKATEAAIVEREVEVDIAKDKVEAAKATLTKDADYWIRLVRNAEHEVTVAEEELIIAKDALKEYANYVDMFPTQK